MTYSHEYLRGWTPLLNQAFMVLNQRDAFILSYLSYNSMWIAALVAIQWPIICHWFSFLGCFFFLLISIIWLFLRDKLCLMPFIQKKSFFLLGYRVEISADSYFSFQEEEPVEWIAVCAGINYPWGQCLHALG